VRWDRRLRRFMGVAAPDSALTPDLSPADRTSRLPKPPTRPPSKPAAGPSRTPPPPTLGHLTPADLASTARLLVLHAQAVAVGRYPPGEAARLRWVAVAEHARRVGVGNPPGLFVSLIRDGGGTGGLAGRVVSQGDEDRARVRLREWEREGRESGGTSEAGRAAYVGGRANGGRVGVRSGVGLLAEVLGRLRIF